MNIELAKNAGFCSGVKHTLAMVWDNLDKMKTGEHRLLKPYELKQLKNLVK